MIRFDNCNYCEYCFEKITGPSSVCPKCGSKYDPHRYPGTLSVGDILAGKYIVGKVLGKGGFGITYLCFNTTNNTRVAIKEYFPEAFVHRDSGQKTVLVKQDSNVYKKGAKKFYEEAKLLSHFKEIPEIVKVEKFFAENNTMYFVMEYLVGKDLKNYFQNDSHPDENFVIYIATEVLKSLKILHARSVIHRDIAPDNIFMCDNGTIKLIDFGASRILVGTVSNSLSVILKPGFAPFEQYKSKGKQGPWTDIYALGATIYYLLKKKVPPDAVSRFNNESLDMSGISPYLANILTKMMAFNFEDRYQSADEVLPELIEAQRRNIIAPEPVAANISTVNSIRQTDPHFSEVYVDKAETEELRNVAANARASADPKNVATAPSVDPVEPKKSGDLIDKLKKKISGKTGLILLCIAAVISYFAFLAFIFWLIG